MTLTGRGADVIIIVMQRLHEDDLIGHVLRQEGWELLSLPAIAEVNEEHLVETFLGLQRFQRRTGETLHSARESVETLENIRQTFGTYNFAGQYQQSPAPAGGGMVKQEWFRRYDPLTLDQEFDQIIQSWDTANKPTELADYSVCNTSGQKAGHFYLLNVFRKKLANPDLKRAVIEQHRLFNPSTILIEDKAFGTQLIQELIEGGLSQVVRFKPDGDKIMRLNAQTASIENGFVHLPQKAHWLPDYLHELTAFPNGLYDDQADSTAQALAWTKLRPPGWGIMEYYRLEAERASGKASQATYRLKAPPGISHVYTMSGQQFAVKDGHVEVSEEDGRPLLAAGYTLL